MNESVFSFRHVMSVFFEPLTKHPFWTITASVIIGISLYVGVDIGLAEVVRQNSHDAHMLAVELLKETDPDGCGIVREHNEMILSYAKHLSNRQLGGLLRLLYPKLSPNKVFASVSLELEKAVSEKDKRKVVQKVGNQINQFYLDGKKFPRSPIQWFKSEDLPDWLLNDLDESLDVSHEIVIELEKEPIWENALAVCKANRKTILLLSLARLGEDDKERAKQFFDYLKRAQKKTEYIAGKEKDNELKEKLLTWAQSEERRGGIIEAMLDNDMDKVCELLRKAIEDE